MDTQMRVVFPKFGDASIVHDDSTGKDTISCSQSSFVDFNELLDIFASKFNYSLKIANGMLDCFKVVSKGDADVIFGKASWDLIPPDESIVPCPPMAQDGYFILSPYNCSLAKALEDSITTDLLHICYSLSIFAWFNAFVAFIFLSFLVHTHHKNHKYKNSNGPWMVLSNVLSNPTFTILNSTSKLIILIVNLFVLLFVTLYVRNVIKTDQLTMTEQTVYRSMEEIIEAVDNGADISVMYMPANGILERLNKPPVSNMKHRLNDILTSNKHGKPTKSMTSVISTLSHDYKSVFIEGMLTTKLVKHFSCSSSIIRDGYEIPDTCIHKTQEKELFHQVKSGFMASKNFSRTLFYRKKENRLVRTLEAGFRFEVIFRRSSEMSTPPTSNLDCLSDSVNTKTYDPGFKDMSLNYFFKSILILAFLLTISMIVLIVEIRIKLFQKFKSQQRKKKNSPTMKVHKLKIRK